MEVKITRGTEPLSDALLVREEVFTREQGFAAPDTDGYDPEAVHVVVYDDGLPVATGRFYFESGVCHPGRIAVLKSHRGKQLGRVVLETLENAASALGAREFSLSAQLYAVPFYEKCGYCAMGERHMDEFCEHETMVKSL